MKECNVIAIFSFFFPDNVNDDNIRMYSIYAHHKVHSTMVHQEYKKLCIRDIKLFPHIIE